MNEPKHPREWLLAQHAGASAKLDALRRHALNGPPFTWRDLFREIFRPHRTAWHFLAATWIAIVIFQLTFGRPPASQGPVPSPVAVAAWFAQLNSYETIAQIDRNR